ncbi:MAG: hypothetical protein AAB414_00265 [Patescibacteria group bacterium]
MQEERPRFERPPLEPLQVLNWPNTKPSLIMRIIDPIERQGHPNYGRGYIGIDEEGNIRSFLHRWKTQRSEEGQRLVRVLSHQGGPSGFDDIERPMRQYVRIIKRYLGIEEVVEEEKETGEEEVMPPLGLREFAQGLDQTVQTVVIGGHKDWVFDVRRLIDEATRGLLQPTPSISLGFRIDPLRTLSSRLNRSTNPYLKGAGQALEEMFTEDDRFKRFAALQRAGGSILDRMREIDEIAISLMVRYRRLEAHRNYSEDRVINLHSQAFKTKKSWDDATDLEARSQLALKLSQDAKMQILELLANPFKERAKRLLPLTYFEQILGTQGPQRAQKVLTDAVFELNQWKEDITFRRSGQPLDRFPVQI